ncbi:hypothetical protein BJ742DRAFT_777206 [Cladochytrium replicatum]|nr:hypothetical protein BJ742DRAFT_777206 [Cladochytrium replicatum]
MLSSLDRRSLSLCMGEPLFHVSDSLAHFSTTTPTNHIVPSAVPKLQVSLGRSVGPAAEDVDIHLGDTKSISRKHARIQYNFETGCFEIAVLGSNGLWINGENYPREVQPISVLHRTKIDISDVCFYFLLPVIDPAAVNSSRVPLPPPTMKKTRTTVRTMFRLRREQTKQQQHSPASSRAYAWGSTRKVEKPVAVDDQSNRNPLNPSLSNDLASISACPRNHPLRADPTARQQALAHIK